MRRPLRLPPCAASLPLGEPRVQTVLRHRAGLARSLSRSFGLLVSHGGLKVFLRPGSAALKLRVISAAPRSSASRSLPSDVKEESPAR